MLEKLCLVSSNGLFSADKQLKDAFSSENSAFLVVGILGRKGVGKSCVLNSLWSRSREKSPITPGPFPICDTEVDLDDLIESKTKQVEVHITSDRVICIDTYPIFHANSSESAQSSDKEPIAQHRIAEIRSIRLISWLFNVCHIVVCVQDSFADIELIKLIDFASSLRPTVLVQSHQLKTNRLGRAQHLAKVLKRKLEKENVNDCKIEDILQSQYNEIDEYPPPEYVEDLSDRDMLSQAHNEKVLMPTHIGVCKKQNLDTSLSEEENLVAELTGIGEFFNHLQSNTSSSDSFILFRYQTVQCYPN
ncbi:smg-9, nonsense mediated mRNA decay factor [Cichlidogyrus casuarinus]|uniref:Smg-9, nonsense mediated mRNA decay factor n=1 Tax=Cichlidogyrus casuarinus TaxID=1844966 RepID=A0ABD2QKD6_9PLAT